MHQYFKSSLLEGADAIPEGHYAADNMKSTVVPFRNGIMPVSYTHLDVYKRQIILILRKCNTHIVKRRGCNGIALRKSV